MISLSVVEVVGRTEHTVEAERRSAGEGLRNSRVKQGEFRWFDDSATTATVGSSRSPGFDLPRVRDDTVGRQAIAVRFTD